MVKLTNDTLKSAMPEPGKRLELRDDQEPGLTFRVTDKGVRSWSIRYRNAAGEHRRKLIGPYPAISLAKARDEARKIKGSVAGGADVVATERLTRAEERRRHLNTMNGLSDAYFDDCALGTHRSNAKPKKPDTIKEERRIYDSLVKKEFGSQPIASITRAEIQAFVSKQSRKVKSNGRISLNVIRQLLAYAVRNGVIETNPAHDIAVQVPDARDTVLSDSDMKRFWSACKHPGAVEDLQMSLLMGVALRMAAVTLQRGGSIIGMEWSEIDRAGRTWLIPAHRMKHGRQHLVPLSDAALELLDEAAEALPKDQQSQYVFPSPRGKGEDKPMDRRAFTRAMKRLTDKLEMDRATPHDLRRTGATNLTSERIGIPRFIVSQVLAHSSDTGGAAAVTGRHYDRNDYLSDKRRALDAWAALLTEIVSGQKRPDNVEQMKRKA
ncbi:tyrosine-type recombinase/integrase [Agrobacterium tumefaciens]|uniref:tyrosine-type recombinase/integrase n=1 Tax=Agrobacterium tumefaciens TaxID=358 RepID=UPI001573B4A4|nr:site-specific integrase [Agrobacterium tumefaciens]NSZ00534.1 tyrosine-type recombinase/integrase [Agrobacterium tumefaciens]NSZ40179.1 tyrosine-type recombinase/integrase [Agrobacterium tumefaciens]NTB22810.1 tyrosine-type recombinase/integrase [Agrobacterium tumefaciens]NTB29320.1 tyrosine-type recombinase/integrase [Agrobacterium tumefaciens]NTB33184.1 tyrosine-type recombinase/integrase [Agrobacterium tumefaciens]